MELNHLLFYKLMLPSQNGPHLISVASMNICIYHMYSLHTFLCCSVVVCFLGYSRLSHVIGKNPFLVGNQRCRAGKVTFLFGSLLRCIIPKTSLWYHWGAVHHSWYLQNIIGFIFQHLPPITLYTRNGKNSLPSFIKQKVTKTYLKIHLKSLFHLCFIEFCIVSKEENSFSTVFFREMFHSPASPQWSVLAPQLHDANRNAQPWVMKILSVG